MDHKSLTLEIKDAEKGQVEAVIATFNVVDHDGDWTEPGAIPDGAKVTISDFGHSSALPFMGTKPAGKGLIQIRGDKAIVMGNYFMSTAHGREAFETVKAMGAEQEWSYGFDVLKYANPDDEQRTKGIRRVLQKMAVYEVSPVLVGAGIGTETLSTKAKKRDEELAAIAKAEEARFQMTRARLLRSGVDLKAGQKKTVDGVALTEGDFAYVGSADIADWKLPIHDAAHVQAALGRWNQTDMPNAGARATARRKLLAAAARHGMDTAGFEKAHPH